MKNFQNSKKNRSIWYSIPVLLVLLCLLVFFAVNVIGFAKKASQARSNKKIAEERILDLEQRKQKLKEDLKELNTDIGKEKVFRQNYGLGKPGEGVINVIEEDAPEIPENQKNPSFWSDVRAWFDR